MQTGLMKTGRRVLHCSLLVCLAAASWAAPRCGLRAEEWTRFRGPNGTGIADPAGIPVKWSESDFNWKVSLPGVSHAQPVVWKDRIFLTSASKEGSERFVVCLRVSDGGTLWSKTFRLKPLPKNRLNSHASGSPCVDADRVYVVFGSPDSYLLLALDHEGKEVWRVDLGPFKAQHGAGVSPIVFEDLVILPNEQAGESFVIAVDRATGKTRWKTSRRISRAAYGTPCIYEEAGGRPALLLTSQAHGISSLDARTGRPNWEAEVFDKRCVSSPVFGKGLAIGTCGSGGGGNYLVALRTGGKGDVKDSHVAYRVRRSIPYVPTPLILGNLLFLWAEKGVVTCLELDSGKVVWRERVEGSYYGSPICAGDKLYCMSEQGNVQVLAAGRKFRLLAENPLGEGSRCTPVVSGGRLYLRTYSHLVSVGGRPAAKVR